MVFVVVISLVTFRTAPEAIKKFQYSSASDAWSFGVVCWEVRVGVEILKVVDIFFWNQSVRVVVKSRSFGSSYKGIKT